MGTISYLIPQDGQPFSTEGPKVDTALTALLNLVNGGLDSTNLAAAAGIAAAQLASGAGFLTPAARGTSGTVALRQLLVMTAAGTTATAPTPTAPGDLFGVSVAGPGTITGANPVTVAGGGNTFLLPGATGSGQSSMVLGTGYSFVVCVWTGSNWQVVSGREDTGWVPLTLGANVSSQDTATPAARRIGSQVTLRGALITFGSVASGGTIATIPSGHGFLPSSLVTLPLVATGTTAPSPTPDFSVDAAGKLSAATALAGLVGVPLYGVNYDTFGT